MWRHVAMALKKLVLNNSDNFLRVGHVVLVVVLCLQVKMLINLVL